eukprot:2665854-Pyramimonas_sp.AAC.1
MTAPPYPPARLPIKTHATSSSMYRSSLVSAADAPCAANESVSNENIPPHCTNHSVSNENMPQRHDRRVESRTDYICDVEYAGDYAMPDPITRVLVA